MGKEPRPPFLYDDMLDIVKYAPFQMYFPMGSSVHSIDAVVGRNCAYAYLYEPNVYNIAASFDYDGHKYWIPDWWYRLCRISNNCVKHCLRINEIFDARHALRKPSAKCVFVILTCSKYGDRCSAILDTWSKNLDDDSFAFVTEEPVPGVPREKTIFVDDIPSGREGLAKKAMLAFIRAKERWPDADWYIEVDDDTWVSYLCVDHYLSKFSCDKPIYGGAHLDANVGYPYVHGGSGIFLSRGLLRHQRILDAFNHYSAKLTGEGDLSIGYMFDKLRMHMTVVPGAVHTMSRNSYRQYNLMTAPWRAMTLHRIFPDEMYLLHRQMTSASSRRFAEIDNTL